MQISQMFKRKPCVFSIECFPPKQTANFDKMKDNLRTMRTLNPDFISVTYGAGGSTGGVSTVEVVVSAVLLAATVVFLGWLAAKIFRFGTLMYGNPIKFTQALKKLREQ